MAEAGADVVCADIDLDGAEATAGPAWRGSAGPAWPCAAM